MAALNRRQQTRLPLAVGFLSLTACLLVAATTAAADRQAGDKSKAATTKRQQPDGKSQSSKGVATFDLVVVRGRVVWLADALHQRYGIRVVAESRQRTLAMQTSGGQLIPLVEDIRGRAFRNDPRLRKMDLELHLRKFKTASVAQIVHVFELRGGKKYRVDYWCDICSIPIFELKACDCCQGPIELRRRLVARPVKRPRPKKD